MAYNFHTRAVDLRAPSVNQNVPRLTLGNEALPIQKQSGVLQPLKGGRQVSLGPIHTRTTTQPIFFIAGTRACPHDCQERTSWTQPVCDPR